MDPLIRCCQFLWPHLEAWLKSLLLFPLVLYDVRFQELKAGIQNLKKARDAIQYKVDEEVNRYGREIHVKVKEWKEAANTTISEYVKFSEEEEEGHQLAKFDLFESGYLPKSGIRHHRSKKAFDLRKRVNELLEKANHDMFSYWLGPPSMDAFFHTVGYESFPSRNETLKMINEALKSPNSRRIGLYGASGVGKKIARDDLRVSEAAKMFDVVVMANVTRNPDVKKIQGQVADMLGMKLDEESDTARAARIRRRLTNRKESTLIILDDLWASPDLFMLGIPLESDYDEDEHHSRTIPVKETPSANVKGGKTPKEHKMTKPEMNSNAIDMMKSRKLPSASSSVKTEDTLTRYKGCKVLLIPESKQVLLSQMEGKEMSIYFMDVLKENEAGTLLKKMAGIGDGKFEFDNLAAQIASKCDGLPMSIVTIARELEDQSRSVWEDALRKLERGKFTGTSDFSTKLSYDLLEDEELKHAFLLCAGMGPDALIVDLKKYCIGLGFLQGIYTMKEAWDRVCVLIGKLKVSGLLSDSYSSDHFTMQNIVRSAALSIASKEKHVFIMTKGKIDEWPDKIERYAVISLHHCHIIHEFPGRINYPRLRFFQVNNNDPLLKIPKNFFKGMKEQC